MNIFFTGCTHFDHENIIELANRPFKDVDQMNETMIKNWNDVVGDKDIVYHLGDFGFFKDRKRVDEILDRLNGKKILIHGNHDSYRTTGSNLWLHKDNYLELDLNLLGKRTESKLVLFHYPIQEWNGFYKNNLHLHCHTHNHQTMGNMAIRNRVNVTVEAWNYTPASLEEIMDVWGN